MIMFWCFLFHSTNAFFRADFLLPRDLHCSSVNRGSFECFSELSDSKILRVQNLLGIVPYLVLFYVHSTVTFFFFFKQGEFCSTVFTLPVEC